MSVKICYVSMAFGTKHDAVSGRTVDYDRIYRELIVPAVQRAGLACERADEFAGTGLILKDICKAVISADVMLADVSSGNANVMYELGIRHGLRRGATVLLTSTPLPSNIAQNYALHYDVAPDGGPAPNQLDAIITQLTHELRRKAEGTVSDSPLYEYFPTLRIELPADLQPPELRSRVYPAEAQMRPSRGPDRKIDVERAEQIMRSTPNVDPQAYLDLLRRYRDLSEWHQVLRLASALPTNVADLSQVSQTVALALMRLNRTEEAIQVLYQHIARTGGDPETRALLGSLYKKRFFDGGSNEDLDRAIEQYERAFGDNRQDLYLGSNLAQLLQIKARGGADDAARDALANLLPELRSLAEQRLADPVPDYWLVNTALTLAVIDGDWPTAETLIDRLAALRPDAWMVDTTLSQLQLLSGDPSSERQEFLQSIKRRLRPARYIDEAEEADSARL